MRHGIDIGTWVVAVLASAFLAASGCDDEESPVAPSVTTQPADQTATEGQPATFAVAATGTAPLSYQWRRSTDGGATWDDVVGATSGTCTILACAPADDGVQYMCVVSNAAAAVDSDVATLTVALIPPVITSDPTDQTVTEGETAQFTVTASGSVISYQWQVFEVGGMAWADVTGGTSATHTTAATVMADDGAQFRCVVTNTGGSATSAAATLTVEMAAYRIVDLSTGGVTKTAAVADLETNDAWKTTHLVLKLIPAGSFEMGDEEGSYGGNEFPVHTVNITQPFYMGVFEVTQKQWEMVEGDWPSYHTTTPDKLPVEQVSWDDINGTDGFMDTLSSLASASFRLPTEAEWEYCCKAGTSTNYSYGDPADGAWMWSSANSGYVSYEVGTTTSKPNPWGLYDMHGNVWEWCEDWYAVDYYASSPSDDPPGPASGTNRVLRGGSWGSAESSCRSAIRNSTVPTGGGSTLGFRVVGDADGP